MIEIHPVSENERPDLYALAQQYWQELMPHAPVVRDASLQPAYFAEQFLHAPPERSQWWARLADDEPARIGFANLVLARNQLGETWGEINDFYILPRWRRQGHGRAFVDALRRWLQEQGARRLDLMVRSDTPGALAFWQSNGLQLASYRLRQYFG